MKRLFAIVGLTGLAVMTAAFYLGYTTAVIIGILSVIALITSLIIRKFRKGKTIPVICIVAILCSLYYCCFTTFYVQKLQNKYSEKTVTVTASVTEQPYKIYNYYYYPLETEIIDGKPEKLSVLFKSYTSIDIEAFDKILCRLELNKCDFSYYLGKGYLLTAASPNEEQYNVFKTDDKPFYYYAIKARAALNDALDVTMPQKYSSLTKALLLGDKYELDAKLKDDFRAVGLTHVIVVSGMHLTIIVSFMMFILKKITKNKYVPSIISIAGVFIFMAITGFSVSIVRSGIMLTIFLIGNIIPRQADSLNSIGFSALVLLAVNPYAVGDVGMLLSFCATIGIILWGKPIGDYFKKKIESVKYFNRPLKYVIDLFAISLAAVIAVTPITILAFGTFTTVVLLSNLLITPITGVVIITGAFCSVTYYMGFISPISQFFALITSAICKYTIVVVEYMAKIPYATIFVHQDFVKIWLFITIAAAVIIALTKTGYKHIKLLACISVFSFIFCFVASFMLNYNVTKLSVLSVGNGSTVTLSMQNNISVLSCGGTNSGKENVLESIEKTTEKVNFMLISGNNAKYNAYAADILSRFDVPRLLLYDNTKVEEEIKGSIDNVDQIHKFTDNYKVYLWNSIEIEVFAIDENVFQYIKTPNKSILILPAKGDCALVDKSYMQADIIVMNQPIENTQLLYCDTLIISQSKTQIQNVLDKNKINFKQIITTEKEDVEISLR